MTSLTIVRAEPAEPSASRAALARHLEAIATASKRGADANRRFVELKSAKDAHLEALAAVEARRAADAAALTAWAENLESDPSTRPAPDQAEIDRLEHQARATKPAHDTAVCAIDAINRMRTDVAHAMQALNEQTPALVGAVLIEENAVAAAEFERACDAARLAGAKMRALRTRLADQKLFKQIEGLPPGFVYDLFPLPAQVQQAGATLAKHADALLTDPNATQE